MITLLAKSVDLAPSRASLAAAPAVLTGVAYYVAAQIAFEIGTLTESFAPLWPPNTVLLCAFLFTSANRWPMLIGASLPAHIVVELQGGMPWLQLLLAYISNCSVALLSATLLKCAAAGPPWLSTLRNALVYLTITSLLCPAAVAFLAVQEPILAGAATSDYWTFWWRWYLSNALGSLTLAPVSLIWLGERVDILGSTISRRIEAAALALGLVLTSMAAFDASQASAGGALPTLLYMPVSMLLWAAVRFGRRGASAAILIVTVVSIWNAMHGRGPFSGGSPDESVLRLQLFLIMASAPFIVIAALVDELRDANGRMAKILASVSDCYFTADREWRVTEINPKAASWFGMSRQNALNWKLPPKLRSGALDETMKSGIAAHTERRSETHPERWIELHAYPSPDGLSVFFRDISKRRMAEQAAIEKEALFNATMDALSARIVVLDQQGEVIAANAAWQRPVFKTTDLGAAPLVGDDYARWFSRHSGRPYSSRLCPGLREMISGDRQECREEYAVNSGPTKSWFQIRATRFTIGDQSRIVVAHEDITEIKRASEALRDFAARVLCAQDEERRRIARDLHDSTCQTLVAAFFNIDRLNAVVPDRGRSMLLELREIVERSVRELRTLSYVLHPPLLDECGLVAALREYAKGFSQRSGIRVNFDMRINTGRLAPAIENALFRVVQESLTNVHRHSGSSVARVRLYRTGDRLILSVADCGRWAGLAQWGRNDGSLSLGVGIPGMRARLRQLDGDVMVRSGHWGTIVRARVPLDTRDDAVTRAVDCPSAASVGL